MGSSVELQLLGVLRALTRTFAGLIKRELYTEIESLSWRSFLQAALLVKCKNTVNMWDRKSRHCNSLRFWEILTLLWEGNWLTSSKSGYWTSEVTSCVIWCRKRVVPVKGGSIHISNLIVLKVRSTKPRYSISSNDLAENEGDFHILAFQPATAFFTDKPNNVIESINWWRQIPELLPAFHGRTVSC